MGKDWRLRLFFPPGEKAGVFLGPEGSLCSRDRVRDCAQYPRASAIPAPRHVLPDHSLLPASLFPRGCPAEGDRWGEQPEPARCTASR